MKNQNLSRAMIGNQNAAGARSGRLQRALLVQKNKMERQELTQDVQNRRLPIDAELENIRRQQAERTEHRNRIASASYGEQLRLAGRKLKRRLFG
jgi:hypothetical protein